MIENNVIIHGDCLDVIKTLPDNSIDAVITDPPYGLAFMGKKWDYDVPTVEIWTECLRVLKPGGYLLSFAGTRTHHRMACAIEDAGFEIRDMIAWVYGSGFPKSLNIGKAVDKINGRFYDKGFQDYCNERRNKKGYSHNDVNTLMGTATTGGGFSSSIMGDKQFNELPTLEMYEKLKPILEMDNRYDELIKTIEREREVIGRGKAGLTAGTIANFAGEKEFDLTKGTSEWEGWGTALKPALEPITVARKPLSEKTVAENCLKWGTGGINIDECRVGSEKRIYKAGLTNNERLNDDGWGKVGNDNIEKTATGRFPANLIHDGSDEVVSLFPNSNGSGKARKLSRSVKPEQVGGGMNKNEPDEVELTDAGSGSAARFFYCAKASKSERNKGCEELEEKISGGMAGTADQTLLTGSGNIRNNKAKNNHPTVKPLALIEYLIKLVSREGATILDPFAGSGTTGIACQRLNRIYILIEKEAEYIDIIKARLSIHEEQNP